MGVNQSRRSQTNSSAFIELEQETLTGPCSFFRYMPLHNLPSLIHTKTPTLTFPSKPAATIPPSPIFRRLQSFFEIGMIEDCGCIFGLVSPWPWDIGRLLHSPNIVGDFGYGWVFWQHGRKLRKACARMLLTAKLYHQPYQPLTLHKSLRMGHNDCINLFPIHRLSIPPLIKALLINQSGNYVSLHAVVG